MPTLKITLSAIINTLIFLSASIVYAENHHSQSTTFRSTQLTDNIFMLQGKGGNLAMLKGEQGLLLIDADYSEMSAALKDELAKHGGVKSLGYLINTHWHGDHTQGNIALGHDAQIIAHDNVRTRLLTSQEIKLFNMVTEPFPQYALPSITFKNRLSLYINNEALSIVHFANGHTDGDAIVFFEHANIVHMGDHFFSGFYPFVDVENGGNVLNMAKNIGAVLSMINDETQVIPGHGPLSDKKGLQAFHDMLIGTSSEVSTMNEIGMSLKDIKAAGLTRKWDEWNDGFIATEVWVEIVYNSLFNK